MKTEISPYEMVRSGLCIGCGSCAFQSPSTLHMHFDPFAELKPAGSKEALKNEPEKFQQTCPFSPNAANETELAEQLFPQTNNEDAALGKYSSAWVGHVTETDMRMQGSSGGMVSWVSTELLRRGLIDGVAHVVAAADPQSDGRFFHYRLSTTEDEVQQGAKSRYYPVEMSEVLQIILETPGRYAITGIPCFIKAVNLLRRQYPVLQERIVFTLGLFCGHMKSARFAESIAWQMEATVDEVKSLDYRSKDERRPADWYNAQLQLQDGSTRNKDWWHLADGDWGAGFFMNHACNFCDDVMAETADISFGDAWVEPYSSDGRGTNVVIVRSPAMEQLIREGVASGRLTLQEVDAAFVTQTQAAGLRQRREGLSYRLTWAEGKEKVRKRVSAEKNIPAERKRIYRMRYKISKWSHRVFSFAKKMNMPGIYTSWAKLALAAYFGFAYHKGSVREIWKRLRGSYG